MTLSLGDRGEQVRELQLLCLMTTVADPGRPDGIFGVKTEAAVHRAQTTLGHKVTCEADEKLLEDLRLLERKHVAIPRVLTPATVERVTSAIARGYESTFPRAVAATITPSREIAESLKSLGKGGGAVFPAGTKVGFLEANALAVRVAVAQLQVEHGADLRAIHVFNLGNQDAVGPGPYFLLDAGEDIDGARELRRHALRAFATLDEGAIGYWARLVEGYADALPAFEAGDAARAAELLKELRYYTAELGAYRRALVDRFAALGGP